MSDRDSWLVLLAAGQGTRLARVAGRPKQFLEVDGVPLYWLSVRTAARIPRLQGLVLVLPEAQLAAQRTAALALTAAEGVDLELRFCAGGARRQDSVARGLEQVPADASFVLVHDAARPFFTTELCGRLMDALDAGAPAVIPGLAVTDTIKAVDAEGLVLSTPPREGLRAVQTPQAFAAGILRQAHAANRAAGDAAVTDDAALMESAGWPVHVVPGEERNMKITRPCDLDSLRPEATPCTGFGYDVHRYGGNRPLKLCGVRIPCEWTIEAHSDGDVALHALMDALLGLAGEGDIGRLFPDTDPSLDGVDSTLLLRRVMERLQAAGVRVTHADVTIVAQRPKLAPHREAMRDSLCALLGLAPGHVNVKATTEERLGFTGSMEGIKAYAVASGLVRG